MDELKHTISGYIKKVVHFECPNCQVPLSTALGDAGMGDECPHCRHKFISPGSETLGKQVAKMAKKRAEKEQRQVEAKPTTPAPAVPMSPDKSNLPLCGNCDRPIGRLEETYTFQEFAVCQRCHSILTQSPTDVRLSPPDTHPEERYERSLAAFDEQVKFEKQVKFAAKENASAIEHRAALFVLVLILIGAVPALLTFCSQANRTP